MAIFRIFIKKKNEFAVESKKLKNNLENILKIKTLNELQIFNLYDISGINLSTFNLALNGIFSEPLIDEIFYELPEKFDHIFAIEFLPGQFDSRASFCEQCVQLISSFDEIKVKTAKVFCFKGCLSTTELNKIKSYLLNPIESRELDLNEPIVFENYLNNNADIQILENFNSLSDENLKKFLFDNGLSMDFYDLKFCQNYFKNIEKRQPTFAEIKVIDTYWSDHCRHTTFLTNLTEIEIVDKAVEKVFKTYLKLKSELNISKTPITLMDLATIYMKKLKKNGKLNEVDFSDEINACSVNVDVKTTDGLEQWLLVFKNETHNHPTEIEPFGGAATCIGGAIRDPLSARAFVFQAMRISGAANPLQPFDETLKGKLPQSKISITAAEGYSSYGNQVGVATGFVQEIYHPSYLAKRLEIGAVLGAVLKKNVVKEKPSVGDLIILLGGKTGRDGCGGASGSSKSHTKFSIEVCGAQVQKGNPVEERKLQRFFRNEKIIKLIKRCNDFGAGGVCVAIGELADGVEVNLNLIPKKYSGLNEVELAISESQERMAIVISPENLNVILSQAELENLSATVVAKIIEPKRLILKCCNEAVVDLSRSFLNSNGTAKQAIVKTSHQKFSLKFNFDNTVDGWLNLFSNLNVCSQKGLVEMFDSTIGAGCVLMPFGGKFQSTKAQAMAVLFPTKTKCETTAVMTFGFNPFLMEQSSFYGSQFAIIESLAKLVAVGGCLNKSWLTFQEFFPSLKNDEKLWGQPFLALLGALNAQINLGVAAIGGKDSMSGTFENLNVVASFVSFAVGVVPLNEIVSSEFKKIGSPVAVLLPKCCYRENCLPDYENILQIFKQVNGLIKNRKVVSVYSIGFGGIAEAIAKMCFGNRIGFKFKENFDENNFNYAFYGGFVLEFDFNVNLKEVLNEITDLILIGETVDSYFIYQNKFKISLDKIELIYGKKLEKIYRTKLNKSTNEVVKTISCFSNKTFAKPLIKVSKVKVLVPIFAGTNCEYDLIKKFEQAGAQCVPFVVNNLNKTFIEKSVDNFAKQIGNCQIIALSGGFSAGDEPDGSAKFIAAFFRNSVIKFALERFLNETAGLMIGICNGFQALIKLGLIEYGKIISPNENNMTLTYNEIGRHQSKIVNVRIACNRSPWLQNVKVGDVFKVAISHGEGRFIAKNLALNKLIENEQIATQYVDFENNATMNIDYNPNGSFLAVEGLTSPDGRIFGKMAHNERMSNNLFVNIPNIREHDIFKSGIDYFIKN